MSMILHLQTVAPRNGLLWLRHGFKVFQRRPIALLGLFAVFMVMASGLMLLPGIGPVLLLMALPLLSLGFMLATHLVLQDKTPTVAVFVAPLQLTPQRRNTQLLLCLAYALATLLVMLLADWADGGALSSFQELLARGNADEKTIEAALAEPALFWGSLLRLSLAALLSVPFWHAPALVHWGGQGVMQALFSSTLGVWRNRQAFALNALSWGGVIFAASLILTVVLALLDLGRLLPLLAMPMGLLISTVFYASLYFTFVDCFMFGAPRDLLDEHR
ncbi:BPSS1780 family membrane protein [Paucibacter sp. APW11]|uniref:BPSS1780 family membrane protein n=1 Tax=Roseateles aquae TaxID=3077235 RepID=A0ABU3PEE4_9BURK|nr:BPSS1780 family membrane protein [Paucibacter sp. APW11]MDT9000517.1 BPSS1780 family membrane protein [Paucibacter sp. APW11]